MKRLFILFFAFLAVLALAGCGEEGIYSGTLVTEGHHTIAAGEVLRGELLVTGGQATLEQGGRLTGSLYMLGGVVELGGAVVGDVSLIGGELRLGPHAQVGGDLDVGGGTLDRAPGATIGGRVRADGGVKVPSVPFSPGSDFLPPVIRSLLGGLIVGALAYLLLRFVPQPVTRVADAIVEHPVVTGAMGLLAGIVGLCLVVLIAFTIILIPVTLLGILLIGGLVVYGWIACGLIVGRRLAAWLKWELRPPLLGFLGTLAFILLVDLVGLIPFIGGIVGILTAAVGFGAVLLTRLGLRTFVPAADTEAGGELG
jgi:hypothetical protein